MRTAIKSSSIAAAATGTAAAITAPAGVVPGDIVIVVVHINEVTANTVTDNNGSTPFTEDLAEYDGTTQLGSVFSRRIQAGDPSTYNFTMAESTRWTMVAIAINNANPNAIYDVAPVSGNSNNTASATTLTSNSINILTEQALHIVCMLCDGAGVAITVTPAGYTIEQNGGNQAVAVGWKRYAALGATGTKSWTVASANPLITFSFAISPYGARFNNAGIRPHPFAPGRAQ